MFAIVCVLFALMIFWSHRDNIRRLLNGQEPKIGAKKAAA
jgi:glycerol-3-phosphate acyltransferase PlsY